MAPTHRYLSRRTALASIAGLGTAAIVGCIGDDDDSNGNSGDDDDDADGNSNDNGDSSDDTSDDGDSDESLSGEIRISGSSTVFPVSVAASEEFRLQVSDDVEFDITRDGSTGGFENFFLDGNSDINGASRPILPEEIEWAEDTGFTPIEIQVAGDALTAIVNNEADWVDCMSIDELQQIWHPDEQNDLWSDIRDDWPDEPFELFGPATTSGTFDYWTEEVVGKLRVIRDDFDGTEEDDLISEGVQGNPHAHGYLPFAYYDNNPDEMKALEIDAGDDCTAPSLEAASEGSYPLARPIFWYVNPNKLQENEALQEFMKFGIELTGDQSVISDDIGYVAMNDEQVEENLETIEEYL